MTTSTLTQRRPPLNVDEAADYLGISVRFVRRLVSERRITFYAASLSIRSDDSSASIQMCSISSLMTASSR